MVEHVRRGRGDGAQQEAARSAVRGDRRRLGRGLDAERDRVAVVDDGGIAADDTPRDLAVDDGRKIPEVPGRYPAAFGEPH